MRSGQRSIGFVGLTLLVAMLGCGGGAQTDTASTNTTKLVGTTLRTVASNWGILIGAAAQPELLTELAYANTLRTEFKVLQAENVMKFAAVHPRPDTDPSPYDFVPADALVSFAQQNSMLVRGHTLIWHQAVPAWLTDGIASGTYRASDLNDILRKHITAEVSHFAGKIYAWDVVNEAFNDDGTMRDTLWYNQPGIGFAGQGTAYIEQALRWARMADAQALLFYNDYNGESVNTKSDAIYAMAKDFKSRGVPLDGIGLQAHVDLSFNNAATLQSFTDNMKRFNDLGLEVHITELDVALMSNDAASLNAQGETYRKITQACLQVPRCKLIQTWGFTDKYSWIPAFSNYQKGWALPFDSNYNKKPAYDGMYAVLAGQ